MAAPGNALANRPLAAAGMILIYAGLIGFTDNYVRVIAAEGGLWQFRVVDSASMYDREYGLLLEKVADKLAAVREGRPPAVAIRRTFTD